MGVLYIDRAELAVNGVPILDLQSASLKRNHNRKVVPTMTPNRRNRGHTTGNLEVDISAQTAVRALEARAKLENVDWDGSDVSINFTVGADQYVVTGVFLKDNDDNSGGVGDEVKASFNFGALDVTDLVGNSALFNLGL